MEHLMELLTDPAQLAFEFIMSLIIDLLILGLLIPFMVKIVSTRINRQRDLAHGHISTPGNPGVGTEAGRYED